MDRHYNLDKNGKPLPTGNEEPYLSYEELEYQIAKDKAQNRNNFYNAKDITNQKGFLSTDRNHNPGSKENLSNIITDTSTNLNPQVANQTIQAPKSHQDWLDWLRKKQIKTGIRKHDKYDYDREDISNFYILKNNLNGKNADYQIAENERGDYYFYKIVDSDLTGPKPEGQSLQSSLLNSKDIITDTSPNLNPQVANQTIKAPKSYQDWLDWLRKKRRKR